MEYWVDFSGVVIIVSDFDDVQLWLLPFPEIGIDLDWPLSDWLDERFAGVEELSFSIWEFKKKMI